MKFHASYLLFSLCFFCFTCSDNKLKVKNNSSKEIIVYYFRTDKIDEYGRGTRILPNSTKSVSAINRTKWEEVFKESSDKKVRFYVYNAELLNDKPESERLDLMRNSKNYLSKLKLSVSELESLNWEITYN